MIATAKNIKTLAQSLKQDFKDGKEKGSFSERLERIILGYSNAQRNGEGFVVVLIRDQYKTLWIDIKI